MGGANALAGSLWPLPEWGLASTIIRESTVHLIAHQCVRVFFRLGISSFVTENLVQSRSIMWMIVSTHLPALPSPEKHESKASEWRRDQQCKQWLWISLWMPGGAWLVRLGQRGWFTSARIILLLRTSTASIILLFLLRAPGPRAPLLREGLWACPPSGGAGQATVRC